LDLGRASSGPTQFAGFSPAKKKRERKNVGPRSAQPFWADFDPLFSGFVPDLVICAGPTHMFSYLINI